MVLKRTGQFSFVDALMPAGGGNQRLDRLSGLVKWYRFEKVLQRLRNDAAAGRPAYPPLMMFKALLLQSLYGLSDMELEEALYDRLSFRRFVGLSLEETVPDHTTLCRFRNHLIEARLLEALFAELDSQLDKAGLILRRGTMLDATIIETGAARPPKGRLPGQEPGREPGQEPGREIAERGGDADGVDTVPPVRLSDPDARFTRRKGRQGSSYGYKAHVGVDEGSGLVRRLITTPANVNDTVCADDLICGDEQAVLADSAYHTHAREKTLKARGIKARLMRRPNKHHRTLPPKLQRLNDLIARRRAAVETTFATWKRRMGLSVIRYRGLIKAQAQVLMTAIAFNMRRWVTLTA
ncbi:IS5 family transposase [Rhizobium sp. CCGE531]|nr:IS5 family transposase [Rhizobium sp. CCGE531]AYG74668.1 IS5 family transposase [Rhizobium sp. CCGE532]AYG68309.1 IS5 family transposase [Rhizobium sp. CCGE531]AYG68339.1 IS5 family transposase [Rhizobium sp. CCGE531]AYG74694.1 IS5 family transposase [Rhizobium sp. CCGE532]